MRRCGGVRIVPRRAAAPRLGRELPRVPLPLVLDRLRRTCAEVGALEGRPRVLSTAASPATLAACLRDGTIPSDDLVDAIAVCKIRCIDVAIQRVHALRQEVGSYALMHDTGFELVDMPPGVVAGTDYS